MSPAEIDTVRETFPNFISPKIAPGTNFSTTSSFSPDSFAPAMFFGEPSPGEVQLTLSGVEVDTGGYDGLEQPVLLPDHGTYFDPQNNSYKFQLGPLDVVPLNKLEARMQVPLTANAPVLTINRRSGRVDISDVDRILLAVQASLAARLPAIASVDIRKCRLAIESTIFFVPQSNFGAVWAGGSTQNLGGGNFQIRLSLFYINGSRKTITNWQLYLVDEAINFFVLSIGRTDLAQ